MRVVQLIDSLQTGGAERMAVNFANALADEIEFSGLIATRKEGALKEQLSTKVDYVFLDKRKSLDIRALLKLKKYIKNNKIDIIHAHSSSFFYAVLVKFLGVRCKIVWHDHNGNRAALSLKQNKPIVLLSGFFKGVITCSTVLEEWSRQHLKSKNIRYIPNFTCIPEKEKSITQLKGKEGKRIVCLANLRNPKNHSTLLKTFAVVAKDNPEWTLHCIGNDYHDSYSNSLKQLTEKMQLQNNIYIYGGCSDVYSILKQCDIGVLLSTYEGFPVALLEYGMSGLSVLSTNVGYCSNVVSDGVSGFLVEPLNEEQIVTKMKILVADTNLRIAFAKNLHTFVNDNFSKEAVIKTIVTFYQSL